MRIVAVVANKGGVGKSTTTLNLGAEFARRGLRTLVVDADKQADLTNFAGHERNVAWQGLDAVLRDPPGSLDPRPYLVERRVRATAGLPAGWAPLPMLLLRSSKHIVEVDAQIRAGFDEGSRYLSRALETLADDIDMVVIDLGHSHELIENVLACAEVLVVPTPAQFPDAQHAGDMVHEIGAVRQRVGLPRVDGMLRTIISPWLRHRGTNADAAALEQLRAVYGAAVSPVILSDSTYVSPANANGMTLREYRDLFYPRNAPLTALVNGYESLAGNVLDRIAVELVA